jgi:anti-sigma-K factor RskA
VIGKEPHTLAGAYAMDALDPLDARRFERHLASCDACTQEVAELRETAARLGAATAVPPPSSMKETVLAQAARTSQHGPVRASGRRRALVTGAAAAAAAVAATAVAFGLSNATANQRLNAAQQRSDAIATVLTAADATMMSGQVSGGGTARVVMSHRMDELVFTAAGLPRGAGGYELWLVGPSGHREAGPVAVSGHGMAGPMVAAGLRPGDHLMLMAGHAAVLDMRL